MKSSITILVYVLACISQTVSLNALFVSVGAAGHVTPVFELAKAMKNHNVTFLTMQSAQAYINFKPYISPSFRIIYANDSPNAFIDEKNLEQQMTIRMSNESLFDIIPTIASSVAEMMVLLLTKTIHVLSNERFDVVVAGGMVFGISLVCEQSQIPCVTQSPSSFPNIFDLNIPNPFSSLTSNDLTEFPYRIYNTVFTTNLLIRIIPKFASVFVKLFDKLPQIEGPFHNTFTLKNILSSKAKCLNLISIPQTFHTPTYSHHYQKYLGAFIDDAPAHNVDNPLGKWIESKPSSSILYGAFGSSSIISYGRMNDLINGLAMFLSETNDTYLLLAFRNVNYETYQSVLTNFEDNHIRELFENEERVKIEKGFVEQKWILQQKSVRIFLSHCGMGSIIETLYFTKPLLCMPFNLDQFSNALTIDHLGLGKSLFVPPSLFQSLIKPYDFVQYTFTSSSVMNKVLILWKDVSYEKAAQLMSLEMKHAGGVKRAVEEIELFVHLHGNLDRFAPFQSTLSFYQRYLIDLFFIFLFPPLTIFISILIKCCKNPKKLKKD